MYLGKEVIHNIFWSAGIDSTYLVCKRLLIDKVPIQTYYLNFPCDGYYPPYPLGRDSREVEVKVVEKLREMIIKQFPYTESLFPPTILVEEFPINKEVYKKLRFLHEEYNHSRRLIDQNFFMAQYALHRKEIFEIGYEKDINVGGYSPATRLLREHMNDDFLISHSEIRELDIYKYWKFPISKTYRKEMVQDSINYDFKKVLENTWSCRWPKPNGDICGGVVEYDDETIGCCQSDYEFIKRKSNYNDILND
jgi:hypothetical protein